TELNDFLAGGTGGREQTQSIGQLIELVAQRTCGALNPRRLDLLDDTIERLGENVVRAPDDLPGLAQIVAGNRQERGAQIAVVAGGAPSVVEACHGERSRKAPGGSIGKRSDRLHPTRLPCR